MNRLTHFFRDRRGIAMVDYGFVGTLIVGAGDIAMRYGTACSTVLKQALPILA